MCFFAAVKFKKKRRSATFLTAVSSDEFKTHFQKKIVFVLDAVHPCRWVSCPARAHDSEARAIMARAVVLGYSFAVRCVLPQHGRGELLV